MEYIFDAIVMSIKTHLNAWIHNSSMEVFLSHLDMKSFHVKGGSANF
jgi:hypothetical protein